MNARGAGSNGPTLSRRRALLGAAALVATPLAPRWAHAQAQPVFQNPPLPLTRPGAGPGTAGLVKLNGNENPYGPSPAAREAILASVGFSPRYADAAIVELQKSIAAREGVAPNQVVIGSGSGELLRMAALLASTTMPGSELVASKPTFEELPDFAARVGLQIRWTPADGSHRHDLAAMRAAIGPKTRLVYLCNPNNPTGTVVSREAVLGFARSVPSTVTVVVDEAYIDFVDAPEFGSVAAAVDQMSNLLVLRTFSKIHGLAGLRVGYALAPPALAQSLADLSLVWPNTLGLAAAAASWNDQVFLQSTRNAILADRARVHARLERLGLEHTAAQGNFVFFDTGRPITQFQERMRAQGLIVGRRFVAYDTWSRVTIGTRQDVDRFLAALPKALLS